MEASTRLLVDRTTVRLDGRPFFTFAVRLFLTPLHELDEAIANIAQAGFTAVMTPPASMGNLPVIDEIFKSAQRRGILVILATEPRLAGAGPLLVHRYKHMQALHSYCLPLVSGSQAEHEAYCHDRDALRAADLFHPIWTPYRPDLRMTRWLNSVDIHSVGEQPLGPFPRDPATSAAAMLTAIVRESARTSTGRPLFCHSLSIGTPDQGRKMGLYDDDPAVRRTPHRSADWYPYLANLATSTRRDLMAPEPDLLRLRVYEILAHRVRGIVFDFYEWLGGEAPFTGRDRFCVLACIAQEVAVFREFLAEGQLVHEEVETGHPRVRAALLRHGDDLLVLAWRNAPGDEYWVDDSTNPRVEVTIGLSSSVELKGWRVDFPEAVEIELLRDQKGAVRFDVGLVDLTAAVLLTRSSSRSRELTGALRARLPEFARRAVEGLSLRLQKTTQISTELDNAGVGLRLPAKLAEAGAHATEARRRLTLQEFSPALESARAGCLALRSLVHLQMAEAQASSISGKNELLEALRRSFYTLPRYYRELAQHRSQFLDELT